MKLSINQNILSESLSKIQSAVSQKNDREILKNILFEVKSNKLKLTATNQEISISTEIDLKGSKDGSTTIPAKKLLPIIKDLPEGVINIETNLKSEMTNIKCGKISFNIQGLPAEDFPTQDFVQDGRIFKFKASLFKRMIESVSYAMGTDKTRQILCGLLFSIRKETFTIVATDGKRLSIVENSITSNEDLDGDSIIPAKSVIDLQRLVAVEGDIDISLGNSYAVFKIGSTILKTSLIEGSYPDYKGAIPSNFDYEVKINQDMVVNAVRRVSLILENSSSSIKLGIKSNLIDVKASLNSDLSSEEIVCESNCDKELVLALNPIYINQALKSQSKDELIIKLTDKDKPVGIFGDKGFLAIIMPMRN